MPIENLVFKGGGVKGVAYVGVLAALEQCGFDFAQLKRVAGTSAGAIIALAFSLGLNSQELKEVLEDVKFELLLDDDSRRQQIFSVKKTAASSKVSASSQGASVGSSALSKLSRDLGLFPGEVLRDLFERLLFWKTGIRNCTFKELKERGFKDLYVVGFNLTAQLAQTFSWEGTPDVIVADAIRISMSIPFVFVPTSVFRKIKGERVQDDSGDCWTDGGVAENYPIRLFDNLIRETTELAEAAGSSPATLGFYLTDANKKAYLEGGQATPPRREINGLLEYTFAVLSSLTGHDYNEQVRYEDKNRTIFIDSVGVDTLDFNLQLDQQNNLMRSGWNAVCAHYQRQDLHNKLPEILLATSQADLFTSLDARPTLLAPLESDIFVNAEYRAIAMLRQPKSSKADNVFLLVEGCNSSGQGFIFRYDYCDQKSTIRKTENYAQKDGVEFLSTLHNEIGHEKGRCWQLTKAAAEQLEKNIISSRENPQKFGILPSDDSFVWCQKMLRSINAYKISSCLPENIAGLNAALMSRHRQVQSSSTSLQGPKPSCCVM